MEVIRRDKLEKATVSCNNIELYVKKLVDDSQSNIYKKAFDYRAKHIVEVDSYDEFSVEEGYYGLLIQDEFIKELFKKDWSNVLLQHKQTGG